MDTSQTIVDPSTPAGNQMSPTLPPPTPSQVPSYFAPPDLFRPDMFRPDMYRPSLGGSSFVPGGFGQNFCQSFGHPQQNLAAAAMQQKPKKVIYVDLKGNQKVFVADAEKGGYAEDIEDERNLNAEAVRPVLDVAAYDGINYQPAADRAY